MSMYSAPDQVDPRELVRPNRGVNREDSGRRGSMIDTGQARLTAELDQLGEDLSILAKKLQPVLNQQETKPYGGAENASPEMSPLASFLNDKADRVASLGRQVRSLTEMVDL